MDAIKSAGTIVVTLLIFIIVGGWMVAVFLSIGEAPTYRSDGSVEVDEYARAKDILVLVLPLLTAVVGYWLGSQGTAKAEDRADKAEAQKTALAAAATDGDLLTKAKGQNPDAFN
jgi:hypothetical protein